MTTVTTAGRNRTPSSSAPATQDRRRVLLISGLAGAGRTTALRALEDLGYEAIDNLPLEFLPHLVSGIANGDAQGPVAIGIDSRSRGFSSAEFLKSIGALRADPQFEIVLVLMVVALAEPPVLMPPPIRSGPTRQWWPSGSAHS